MRRLIFNLALVLPLVLTLPIRRATGQTTSYTQTNLTSDGTVVAPNTDKHLINPWGVAFIPGSPFWISDNNSGFSTLYDNQGVPQSLVVTIPPPMGAAGPATPTGIVANTTSGFAVNGSPAFFIFSTEDGTISAWTSGNSAVLAVNNPNFGSGTDPVYKGLALLANSTGSFLVAANFRNARIDVFDSTFKSTTLSGNFIDPTLPAGFAPFGVHVLNGNQVYVSYAMQNAAKHDPVNAPGNGYVSLFDANGNFVRRVISQGQLNSPWGIVIATANFGQFSNDLLVGNFGDGTINAFDPATGNFLGTLKDANGNALVNGSLWDLVFDSTGQTGVKDTLYFTAGLVNEADGLFGAIAVGKTQPTTANFSVAAASQALTVMRGRSVSTSLTITPSNGFNGTVSFACSGLPGGATCSFSPTTVMLSGASAATQLTISAAAVGTYPVTKMGGIIPTSRFWPFGAALAVFFLLLLLFVKRALHRVVGAPKWIRIALVAGLLAAAVGCGYKTNNNMGTPTGTTTVMVNATSGKVMQSTSIALTVQ
ncbi:MAG TPA: TIGR03118 family protein [Candidatus Acidoferrales bacterium]|nr:TIGR03118 family protein [Candidatus Acidoferrales bacterium]